MKKIDSKLKKRLLALSDKYEKHDFILKDPSQFMHNYSNPLDQEIAAFITAQLSFGRRELFIAKLKTMFEAAGKSPSRWILEGKYEEFFCEGEKKFYRFYSHDDMKKLCETLKGIVGKYGSLGKAVEFSYEEILKSSGRKTGEGLCETEAPARRSVPEELELVTALIELFPGCACVSQNAKSACKRLHMFLRWMIRKNSEVDLGLWKWVSPEKLLIPLDVHVLQEGKAMGLLEEKSGATAKTAICLTEAMKEVFPGDPSRADFALFGLGVDTDLQ